MAFAQVKGDLNDDGSLSAADALLLQHVLEGELTLPDESVADVAPIGSGTAGNGTVDAADLLVLLRALEGDDIDGDGLGPEGENAIGTSAFLEDTDGDGLSDSSDPNPTHWDPNSPVLDPPTADPTNDNPYYVTGTGDPETEILLYVDGEFQDTVVSSADGSFSIAAALLDGANNVHATARLEPVESSPSNSIVLNYQNNLPRTYSGQFGNYTLNQDTVWTPGDGTPYVINGNLIVDHGVTFTVQAGTEIRIVGDAFDGIDVWGTIRILGELGSKVRITSGLDPQGVGDYQGISITRNGNTDHVIDHAIIEYARFGVSVNEDASIAISNSEMRFFRDAGISFSGPSSGIVSGNHIHDGDPVFGDGIELSQGCTPLINGNNIIELNKNGVRLYSILGQVPPDPRIEDNTIRNNDIGISAVNSGHSQTWEVGGEPITGLILNNRINQNRIGIYLKGENSRSGAVHPELVVNGNDLSGNTEFAVFLQDYDSAQSIQLDFQGNYWGPTVPAEIAALIGFYEGPETSTIASETLADVPVEFSNFLDGYGGSVIPGVYFTTPITAVGPDRYSFRPSVGETVSISFTVLSSSATVGLEIYNEADDDFTATALRSFPPQSYAAGTHSIVWDGKDANDNYLTDEAYTYLFTATAGGVTSVYAPTRYEDNTGQDNRSPGYFLQSSPFSVEYNPFRNEGFAFTGQLIGRPVRWDLRVGTLSHDVFMRKPVPTDRPDSFRWDGRSSSGAIRANPDTTRFVSLDNPYGMRPNAVIIEGHAPTVSGVSGAIIESDPFLIVPSFGQSSTIRYQLDQAADVEIKIVPPGSASPNSPAAILLQPADGTAEPAGTPLEVPVSGVGPSGELLFDQDGTYTITIEATSTATGASSLYRGALQVRR